MENEAKTQIVERSVKSRQSNFELLRIVLMVLIVLHHFCVNSGLFGLIDLNNITANTIILQFLAIFGKMGIAVFVLISGYFMINSKITFKKIFLLWSEALFYHLIIGIIFWATGYSGFSKSEFIKYLFYVTVFFDNGFVPTYLGLMLLSPFINKAIKSLTQKQFFITNVLLFVLFSTITTITFRIGNVSYFVSMLIIYMIGAYLRLYPNSKIDSKKCGFILFTVSVFVTWLSIIVVDFVGPKVGFDYYFYMASNQASILMISSAVGMFIWFKNMNIKQNKIINTIAHSTIGVLFIHANSDAMRQWLWQDVCKNTTFFTSPYFILIAIGVSLAVYFVCVAIDLVRWQLLEKPIVNALDKKDFFNKVQNKCINLMNKIFFWFSNEKKEIEEVKEEK